MSTNSLIPTVNGMQKLRFDDEDARAVARAPLLPEFYRLTDAETGRVLAVPKTKPTHPLQHDTPGEDDFEGWPDLLTPTAAEDQKQNCDESSSPASSASSCYCPSPDGQEDSTVSREGQRHVQTALSR